MRDRLFIKIPDQQHHNITWAVWSNEQQQWLDNGELLAVDLNSLAAQSTSCETIVIVPATVVIEKKVVTPAKQLKQIQKVVPYSLEEQLADTVDQLHFAYGKRSKQGEIYVEVVKQAQMEQWLEWFEQAELTVDSVVNELSLLHHSHDATEVYLFDEAALVREIDGTTWCCQRSLLTTLWQRRSIQQDVSDSEDSDLDSSPMVRISYVGELDSYWSSQSNVITQPLTASELLKQLANNYQRKTINLLQGAYVVNKESQFSWQKFKLPIYAATASIVIFLVMQGVNYFTLSKENDVLQKQAEQLFTKVFSRRPRGSNILGQVKRLLRKSSGSNSQQEFISMMTLFSNQLPSADKIIPTSITYDNRKNELRVDILAEDYSSLSSFQDALKQPGFDVEMKQGSSQGDKKSSRVIIRTKS
ncbi:MAG: type II secretion system protein GspL [Kangiellaceae bacterium]|jgi:general secretion pathway protein L|nr:type II secretion system protein GspL [Kangiellaceae bacterium]